MDYTTSEPSLKNCPRCFELWNKNDSNAYIAHVWEHVPRPKKKYAFTLTTNGNDVMEEQEKLCLAVEKLFRQRTVPIEEGGAWLEYTAVGRPHIHGWYTTEDGGRVFAKVFQRCWPLWKEKRGAKEFPGGYHEEMKKDRYLGYASAEGRQILVKNLNVDVQVDVDAREMRPESGILNIDT